MTDDEFVVRTGQLWRWIDDAWNAALAAAVATYLLFTAVGGFLFGAVDGVALLAATAVAIRRERRRLFPGDSDADPA